MQGKLSLRKLNILFNYQRNGVTACTVAPFSCSRSDAFGIGSYMAYFQENLLQEKKSNTNLTFLYYLRIFVLIKYHK